MIGLICIILVRILSNFMKLYPITFNARSKDLLLHIHTCKALSAPQFFLARSRSALQVRKWSGAPVSAPQTKKDRSRS